MSLATANINAYQDYMSALDLYYQYVDDRDAKSLDQNATLLDQAIQKFDDAIGKDPKYFLPRYYKAVVHDLKGMPHQAAQDLAKLIKNPPKRYKPLVQYAFGISLYHQYDEDKLKEAISQFNEIIGDTQTVSDKENTNVKQLATAAKIQAQAVQIMFYNESDSDYPNAKKDFDLIKREGDALISTLSKKPSLNSEEKEALWVAYNAVGLAHMYLSDSIRYGKERAENEKDKFLKELDEAHSYFTKAEEVIGIHWPIRSNFGSLQLRKAKFILDLGDQAAGMEEFDKAQAIFDELLQNVRPDYDFAYYEKAKIKRYQRKFDEAKKMINEAKEAGARSAAATMIDSEYIKQLKKIEEQSIAL